MLNWGFLYFWHSSKYAKMPKITKHVNTYIFEYTQQKKWSFSLRIFSVNVAKSTVFCGFAYIYWKNPEQITSYFVQWSLKGYSYKNIKNWIKQFFNILVSPIFFWKLLSRKSLDFRGPQKYPENGRKLLLKSQISHFWDLLGGRTIKKCVEKGSAL